MRKVILSCLGVLISVGLLTTLVNPFDQWPLPRLTGLADNITETRWDIQIKSYQSRHQSFDTVIIGSSKAAVAFRAEHPAFEGRNVYNYGLSGAGIYLNYHSLRQALSSHALRHVILVPEFFGFNAYLRLNQPDQHGHPEIKYLFPIESVTDTPAYFRQHVGDTLSNTIGWRGINSSLRTLIAQNEPVVYIDRQGFWQRFHTREMDYVKQYQRTERLYLTEMLFPPPHKKFEFVDPDTGFDSFALYRQLLDLANREKLQITIVVLPTPPRDLIALQLLGKWDDYLSWKRRLVVEAEVSASRYGQPLPVIQDFENGLGGSESDNLIDMKPWFHEPFHPTAMTGTAVANNIFFDCGKLPCWPGQHLDSSNLNAALSALNSRLTQYREQHPEQMAQLIKNIDRTRSYRAIPGQLQQPLP